MKKEKFESFDLENHQSHRFGDKSNVSANDRRQMRCYTLGNHQCCTWRWRHLIRIKISVPKKLGIFSKMTERFSFPLQLSYDSFYVNKLIGNNFNLSIYKYGDLKKLQVHIDENFDKIAICAFHEWLCFLHFPLLYRRITSTSSWSS